MFRYLGFLIYLTGCGGSQVAGTYVVSPTLAFAGCPSCPPPNPTVYKIAQVSSKGYTIAVGDAQVVATYDEGSGVLEWETTLQDAAGGCTEHDTGHVTVKPGKFDGYLNVQVTCGGSTCLCAYNLSGRE